MSVISFGPSQPLSAQQRAAYQSTQQVKQAVWDTSHRLAALNNVPGVDDPTNGDNVDISSAVALPAPPAGSHAVFEAQAVGSVQRSESGQIEKAEVRAQLPDGRQWDFGYQHQGDMLAYTAPSPSGKSQMHVVENLSNGTIAMFEAPQLVPDFAAQLQTAASAPPVAATPVPAPPSAPGWSAAPAAGGGILDQAGGFFKKFLGGGTTTPAAQPAPAEQAAPSTPGPTLSEMAQQGKAKAVEAVQSDTGRKWGKLLIGGLGMNLLDKAIGSQSPTQPSENPNPNS